MNHTISYPPGRDGGRRGATLHAVLLTALLAGLSLLAHAEDNPTESTDPNDRRQPPSLLDGQAFKGEIGRIDEPAFSDDVWNFDKGMFAARKCHECGKGEYWMRPENGAIRFRAETVCPDTGAALAYTGLVKDDRIEGTFTWTKGRWYGDIEKKFWFKGSRIENAELAASQSSASIGPCGEIPDQRPTATQRVPASVRDTFLKFP